MALLLGLSVFFVACDSGTESGGQNTEQSGGEQEGTEQGGEEQEGTEQGGGNEGETGGESGDEDETGGETGEESGGETGDGGETGEEGDGEGETGGEDPAPVPDVSDKLVFTLNDEETAYSVTDMDTSAAGSVTIPSTYNGLPVTSIGSSAFSDCSDLTEITIPEGVTSIGNRAFYECSSLTEITIPEGVTSISTKTFSRCSRLIKITLPEGVTSIGLEAFAFCVSLTEITVPASVTRIDTYAFYDCVKLIEIYNKSALPLAAYSSDYGGIARYAKNIYTPQEGCSWFTDADGYRFFYDGSNGYLMGYNGTKSALTLPTEFTAYNGVAVEGYIIYSYTFAFGSDLTEIIIPDSVTGIGAEGTFANCSSLTEFTIPDCVTDIGDSMFSGCSNLQSIKIPDGVTSIGLLAFYSCSNLTEVIIPDSVTSISYQVFSGTALYKDETNWENGVLYIGNHLIKAKATLANYYTIKSGTLTIADRAFLGCDDLTGITIPDGLINIGSSAFESCDGLTEIVIPDSVTSIGLQAFCKCSNLTSATLETVAGWWRTLTSTSTRWTSISSSLLADPSTAATYLTSTYDDCYWHRS